MTERRPYTEPFGQFCDILNRCGVDDIPVRFLGRTALIDNRKASGRPKDLADVDLLTSDDPDRTA